MKKTILLVISFLSLFQQVFAKTIHFSAYKNTPGKKLVIAAVGDILMHQALQVKAAKSGFDSLWVQAIPYLQKADITFGNLEGPVAHGVSKSGKLVKDPGHRWDNNVYSSYPRFNAHPSLAEKLHQSGFDILSFANNHSLDRFGIGVDRTIENLDRVGLKYAGAKSVGSQHPWFTIVNKNGFKTAWIACTQDTNGMKDHQNRILYCYKKRDQKTMLRDIHRLKNKVDAIIIAPHWGVQYKQYPSAQQKHFAKRWLDAGALAVIGNHPHCLQPMQKYITKDGRETFIAYSLGNFVSYQGTPKNRATVILYLTLKKMAHGTVIDAMHYVPAYMQNRSGYKKLSLRILNQSDRNSVGYRIIKKILPTGNMI